MLRRFVHVSLLTFAAGGAAVHSDALQIDLDFGGGTFFGNDAQAIAAVQAAAQDLSDLILTPLEATQDKHSATVGNATANFDFSLDYTDPYTGSNQTVNSAAVPSPVITVHVGARPISGSTLGEGGPGGAGYGVSVPYAYSTADPDATIPDIQAAVTQAASAAQADLLRGGGPVVGTLIGEVTNADKDDSPLSEYHAPISISYGVLLGNLWFDNDTDDSDGIDTSPVLSDYWHFDHTTDVADDKFDLYSVALHELMHVLGIGGSETWESLVSGDDWLGSAVGSMVGGTGIIDSGDYSHIKAGQDSFRFGTNIVQEAAMDPNLTAGERKYVTDLDAAFLTDIGWQIVPEPASLALLAAGGVLLLRRRG